MYICHAEGSHVRKLLVAIKNYFISPHLTSKHFLIE